MPRYAPLSLIISALSTVLSPTPLPASVPAALKLLVHLQLLDRQLIAEAARALDAHREIVAGIYGECGSSDAVNQSKRELGTLSDDEIQVLKRIMKRGRRVEDRLFVASMWIRHWHTIGLLNSSHPLEKIQPTIQSYYPPLPDGPLDQATLRKTKSIFIRSMTPSEVQVWRTYKNVIDTHIETKRSNKHKTIQQTIEISDIVGTALRAAQLVHDDTVAFSAMFDSSNVKQEPLSPPTAELGRSVPRMSFFGSNEYALTPSPAVRRRTEGPAELGRTVLGRAQRHGETKPRRSLPLATDERRSKRPKLEPNYA